MMIWNEIGLLLFPFGVGIACAAFYFGGLRWTLQRVATRSGAAKYLLLSFLIRSVIVLAAFYLAANGRWQHVLASMAGFLLGRTVMLYRARRGGAGWERAAPAGALEVNERGTQS
ncbi:MAG: ATP synthase subunit I [Chloroflexota bacterium]